ncbi:MAG: hypothetical protein SFW66_03735 [Gammaproteobacteria bacterium]|nr:hypothetical protein [Gammaproteobacteria bacterium]
MDMTYQNTQKFLLPLFKIAKDITSDSLSLIKVIEELSLRDSREITYKKALVSIASDRLSKSISDIENHYSALHDTRLNMCDGFRLARTIKHFLLMINGIQELGLQLDALPFSSEITRVFHFFDSQLTNYISGQLTNELSTPEPPQSQRTAQTMFR